MHDHSLIKMNNITTSRSIHILCYSVINYACTDFMQKVNVLLHVYNILHRVKKRPLLNLLQLEIKKVNHYSQFFELERVKSSDGAETLNDVVN